jgi:hypothetical protein
MEPAIEAFTTSYSPARSAASAMISSAALPNVALSSPPTPSPGAFRQLLRRAPHPSGEGQDGERGSHEDEKVALWRQVFQGDRDRDDDQQPVQHAASFPDPWFSPRLRFSSQAGAASGSSTSNVAPQACSSQ